MTETNAQNFPVHPTHGPFVKEGLMIAFPLCFPGMTDPIPLEESRITALALGPMGVLYGGTSGKVAHVFAAYFKGPTGAVWDLGLIDGATDCVGVACGDNCLVAAVNGPDGSRIVSRQVETVPDFDLLQEWSFIRRPYRELEWELADERILDLVGIPGSAQAIGISEHHVFCVDIDRGRCEVIGAVDAIAHVMAGSDGTVYGLDAGESLWSFHPTTQQLTSWAVALPPGVWSQATLVWTCDPGTGAFYLADPIGNLYLFLPGSPVRSLGMKVPMAPVRCMAVVPDGRIYGFCGDQIEHLFVVDPTAKTVSNLGVAVSVIERRRYGYRFSAALTNLDGHVFFGENDNLGHLWIYFPTLKKR